MSSILHQIADEKVDVYAENAKFSSLLEDYYANSTKKSKDDAWIIAFRAACNLLKKRFGRWWKYDDIEQLALDMVSSLFARVEDREKWPDGYRVLNLPTVLKCIMFNLYYGKSKREQREFERRTAEFNENIHRDANFAYGAE